MGQVLHGSATTTEAVRQAGSRDLWRPLPSVLRSRRRAPSRPRRPGRCQGSAAAPLPKSLQAEPQSFRLSLSKPATLPAAASEVPPPAEQEAVVSGALTEASGVAGRRRPALVGGEAGAEAQRGATSQIPSG